MLSKSRVEYAAKGSSGTHEMDFEKRVEAANSCKDSCSTLSTVESIGVENEGVTRWKMLIKDE